MSVRSDKFIPDHIWKITMHYHDLIYIKSYWESIGQHAPPFVLEELQRVHDILPTLLEEEQGQGGAYHKLKGET
jgi:hypothetical protein